MSSTSIPSAPTHDHVASPVRDAKWATVVGDRLIPMPRRHVPVRLIKAQANLGDAQALVRDHNSPNDVVLDDHAEVDLALGNVFYGVPKCELSPRSVRATPAKLAFVVNDRWEVVLRDDQTGHMLRDVFALPPTVELLRDYESPFDEPIADDEVARFPSGPVFRTTPRVTITIFVNNKPVKMHQRRVTALQIKEAAIQQDMNICKDCVLYRIKPDGSHSAAIRDHEHITIHCDEHFRCIAPDDNS
jgi:hypothetical protein